MSKPTSELMLLNEHASVTLSSLVYDPAENDLLVAALTVAPSAELLAAIKAQLEKHSRNALRGRSRLSKDHSIPQRWRLKRYFPKPISKVMLNLPSNESERWGNLSNATHETRRFC